MDGGGDAGEDGGAARSSWRMAYYEVGYPYQFTASPPHETPSAGFYNTNDTPLVQSHLEALRYAHVDIGLASWWGPGTPSDNDVSRVLNITTDAGSPLRWAVMYRREPNDHPDAGAAAVVLRSIRDRFASRPSYAYVDGGFLFVLDAEPDSDPCSVSQRWVSANDSLGRPAFLVLRAPNTGNLAVRACSKQPAAWLAWDQGPGFLVREDGATLMPAWWESAETAPRLSRDLTRFRQQLAAWNDAGVRFRYLVSFNNWPAGTQVESATNYPSDSGYGAFVDALHDVWP